MLWIFITYCMTNNSEEWAPNGRGDGDHVVDHTFVFRVGDIGNVKDVSYGAGQTFQAAT